LALTFNEGKKERKLASLAHCMSVQVINMHSDLQQVTN